MLDIKNTSRNAFDGLSRQDMTEKTIPALENISRETPKTKVKKTKGKNSINKTTNKKQSKLFKNYGLAITFVIYE